MEVYCTRDLHPRLFSCQQIRALTNGFQQGCGTKRHRLLTSEMVENASQAAV